MDVAQRIRDIGYTATFAEIKEAKEEQDAIIAAANQAIEDAETIRDASFADMQEFGRILKNESTIDNEEYFILNIGGFPIKIDLRNSAFIVEEIASIQLQG